MVHKLDQMEGNMKYITLYRDILLGIMDWYTAGIWAHCLPHIYWDRLIMIACVGGYYGAPCKGDWDVT